MSCSEHTFRATDDDFIRAAGFNPEVYPETISVFDYLKKRFNDYPVDVMTEIMGDLEKNGFGELKKKYTLEERFKMYGVDAKIELDFFDENEFWSNLERRVVLSNGMVLEEVPDQTKTKKFYNGEFKRLGFEQGYDYVTVYSVKRK